MHNDELLRVSQSELEELACVQGREWARRLIEENPRLRAIVEERRDVVDAKGKARKYVRCSERHLKTTLGPVPVPRMAYRSPGCEGIHPIDAALNRRTEVFSRGVQRMVAEEAGCSSYDEVVDRVCRDSGATIVKRQVEELSVCAAQDFDASYAKRADSQGASDELLVISTDGKGIVMWHEDLRKGTKRAAERSKHKIQTSLTPGEKRNRKRMAQVATVYSVERYPRRAVDIVQRGHAVEPCPTQRPCPTDKRVWATVEKDKTLAIRDATANAVVDKTGHYVLELHRAGMLGHAEAVTEGLPIATGVLEGPCRYVVKDRMDRCGARWSLVRAEAVQRLRAVRASDILRELLGYPPVSSGVENDRRQP